VRQQLLAVAAEKATSDEQRAANVMFVIGALPEFQLG
jgi:hypothetical protein